MAIGQVLIFGSLCVCMLLCVCDCDWPSFNFWKFEVCLCRELERCLVVLRVEAMCFKVRLLFCCLRFGDLKGQPRDGAQQHGHRCLCVYVFACALAIAV